MDDWTWGEEDTQKMARYALSRNAEVGIYKVGLAQIRRKGQVFWNIDQHVEGERTAGERVKLQFYDLILIYQSLWPYFNLNSNLYGVCIPAYNACIQQMPTNLNFKSYLQLSLKVVID